jgi:hypothetical protein
VGPLRHVEEAQPPLECADDMRIGGDGGRPKCTGIVRTVTKRVERQPVADLGASSRRYPCVNRRRLAADADVARDGQMAVIVDERANAQAERAL